MMELFAEAMRDKIKGPMLIVAAVLIALTLMVGPLTDMFFFLMAAAIVMWVFTRKK